MVCGILQLVDEIIRLTPHLDSDRSPSIASETVPIQHVWVLHYNSSSERSMHLVPFQQEALDDSVTFPFTILSCRVRRFSPTRAGEIRKPPTLIAIPYLSFVLRSSNQLSCPSKLCAGVLRSIAALTSYVYAGESIKICGQPSFQSCRVITEFDPTPLQ